MPKRTIDSRVVYRGVLMGELRPEQGAVLFRQDKQAAGYFLNDRLTETLGDPAHKDATDLSNPPARFMEMYWHLFGASQSVVQMTLFKCPLVDAFFRQKLTASLDAFSDEDMRLLQSRYYNTPMHDVVEAAQARKLVPLADVLLKNPAELNIDIAELKKRVSAYDFTPELNEVLDKVEHGLGAGCDAFDQAAMLKHLRTFFEKLHEQVGLEVQKRKPETTDGTNLTSFGQAVDFLTAKKFLTEKMRVLAKGLYGVLSNEGVHALKSKRNYVRLCRNMIGEYGLVLFAELERRLETN